MIINLVGKTRCEKRYACGDLRCHRKTAIQRKTGICRNHGKAVSCPTTVPAFQWGIDNEPCAQQYFLHNAQHEHFNLRYFPAGLFINWYPHLGATPDGIISCDCCGTGIIEIKCPYKYCDSHLPDVHDDTFYLLHKPTG